MACPVVAVHRARNEIIIYGGTVHFARESVTDSNGRTIYGICVKKEGEGWGAIIKDACLTKLSQEHGVIEATSEIVNDCKPGDIIKVIPAHSCITASLMKEYVTTGGRAISRL